MDMEKVNEFKTYLQEVISGNTPSVLGKRAVLNNAPSKKISTITGVLKIPQRENIMKRTLSLVGLFVLMLAIELSFTGCGLNAGSPSNIVKQLITAIENEDKDTVVELTDEPFGKAVIRDIAEFKKFITAKKGIAKITEAKDYNDGFNAFVGVDFKDGTSLFFSLARSGGKWIVYSFK